MIIKDRIKPVYEIWEVTLRSSTGRRWTDNYLHSLVSPRRINALQGPGMLKLDPNRKLDNGSLIHQMNVRRLPKAKMDLLQGCPNIQYQTNLSFTKRIFILRLSTEADDMYIGL